MSAFFQNLDDPVAYPEDSLMYARALLLAGAAPGAVHMYPKGGHGFGVCAQLDPVGGFEMVRVARKTACATPAPRRPADPPSRTRASAQCCEWPQHALRFLQGLGFAPGWPGNITSARGL